MARLPTVAVSALETLINGYLGLDDEVLQRLGRLHGQRICFEFSGFDLRLWFVPAAGRLQLHAYLEGEPDCLLRGSPLALAALGFAEEKSGQLFGGRVEIVGDAGLAHRFGQILAAVDIDWEEQLSRLVGDVPAHQAGRAARGLRDWAGKARRSLELDIGEYLQEEIRLAPRAEEVADFAAEVDTLRDDVERLQARVERLHRRLELDRS